MATRNNTVEGPSKFSVICMVADKEREVHRAFMQAVVTARSWEALAQLDWKGKDMLAFMEGLNLGSSAPVAASAEEAPAARQKKNRTKTEKRTREAKTAEEAPAARKKKNRTKTEKRTRGEAQAASKKKTKTE